MSTFLYELGHRCYRSRKQVVVIWAAVLLALGVVAGLTGGKYTDNFTIPGAPSQTALDQLRMSIPSAAALHATAIVIVPEGQTVNDPQIRAAIEAGATNFEQVSTVDSAISPWNPYFSGLINDDQRAALIELQLNKIMSEFTDADRQQLVDEAAKVQAQLPAGTTVNMGGEAFAIEVPTLSPIEAIGVAVALVVLFITLGSLIAAGLPILNALVGVGTSMLIILIAAAITKVNSTTPLLAVMLGLAVGIDYSLFILSRHRDQLAAGEDPAESAAKAIGTAGSAVVFAGLTVFIALLGLGLGGIPFLTIMGVFGAVAVAIAVLVSLTLLPAIMGFLGSRIAGNKHPAPTTDQTATGRRLGFFGRWAQLVTRVPVLTIVIVVAGLGALAIPATNLQMSLPNSGQHEQDQADRVTYDLISHYFGVGYNAPLIVTADIITSTDPLGVMAGLKNEIEAMPGVKLVGISTPNQNADMGFVQLIPTTGPDDEATADLVQALRAKYDSWQDEYGVKTAVTGATAIQIDVSTRLGQALLPFGVFVVGLCLILLMMVFRSIWVPVKATLGYLLSVGAAFGATQLVFNEGHLKWLVNLEKPTPIISFMPIVIMGILFGLAMDYEVFLVSRIREEYVHGLRRHPELAPRQVARQAIQDGFVGSGKVVAAAAVIMFGVFAFFVPEGMGPIKQIAFGLAVGVAVDAFLVRMTLVPAVMYLLAERAWGLPKLLDRALPSFDVEGEALTHQIARNAWPSVEHHEALHAEGLRAATLFTRFDAHLEPGQIAVLAGDTVARSAAMLALAGRLQITHGQARVAGKLLPEQAGRVRRATGFVETTGNTAIAGDLRAQLARPHRVIFVNGADAIASPEDSQALATLIDRARSSRDFGVVLGVSDPQTTSDYQPEVVIAVSALPASTPAPATPAEPDAGISILQPTH